MRKTLPIFLAVVIIATSLGGCKATPDEPVVKQKDLEQMIDTAVSDMQLDGESIDESTFILPEYYTTEPLHNAQGTLTVNIDAKVIASYIGDMPTARVAKHLFTEEEAARFVETLFEGQQTYSSDVLLTKPYYQERVLELQAQLATETDGQKKQELQQSIQKYQSAITDLPQGEGLVETMPEFVENQNGIFGMHLLSDGDDGTYRTFSVLNDTRYNLCQLNYSCNKGKYLDGGFNFYDESIATELKHGREAGGKPEQIANPQMSAEQAIAIANEQVEKLGLGCYVCSQCDLKFGCFNGEWINAYELVFMRRVNRVPFTYINLDCDGAIDDGKGGFVEGWGYEKLSIFINDSGIIYLSLKNPYDVTEVLTEESMILPFNQIMETFKKMIVVTNADTQADTTFDINRITLGLARITDTQTREQGVVIPVWDFFGTRTVVDGEEIFIADDPTETHLTINAIDGSIIDRRLGY